VIRYARSRTIRCAKNQPLISGDTLSERKESVMTYEEFTQAVRTSESEAVKAFMAGIDAAKPEEVETLFSPKYDKDTVQKYLGTQDGYLAMQPYLDKAKNEEATRFRDKELPKLQEDYFAREYAKKHPPENPEVAALQKRVLEMEQKDKAHELRNFALKHLNEKKLPVSLLDFLALDEEEAVKTRINTFSELMTARVNEEVQARISATTKKEPAGASASPTLAQDAPRADRIQAKMDQFAATQKG
jgi:Trp operon repressor